MSVAQELDTLIDKLNNSLDSGSDTIFGDSDSITHNVNPDFLDLYALHPDLNKIEEARFTYNIKPVDELWMITTRGERTGNSIETFRQWYDLLNKSNRPKVRIWQLAGVEDLASEEECCQMKECIYRVVLCALDYAKNGQLIISIIEIKKE